MVDFQSETIVNTPSRKIVTVLYIQRSEWLQDAWEEYNKSKANEIENEQHKALIKARLISLFKRMRPTLKKSKKEEEFVELKNKIVSDDVLKWEEATDELEEFLYDKNITRLDTTKPYDPTDLEGENEIYGL